MIQKKLTFIFLTLSFASGVFILSAGNVYGQVGGLTTDELKKLSIEDLMNMEVTSVSKRPERLADVASAIQVLTREDIRRSAATSVPEALRLVPNLQVTQLNSHHWNISARGFNSNFSNKLLVMIDGRTVYSPLFAGVFWDAQNVLLEDVDRIEVISGPGATVWGANAVNGVINIITKNSADTQGLFLSAGVGTELKYIAEARYGGKIGDNLSYRVYGMRNDRDDTLLPDGGRNADAWTMTHGGVQMDWDAGGADRWSVHGNAYKGIEKTEPSSSVIDGQNVLASWTHAFSGRSEISLQGYFDRTWRLDVPNTINEELETYDIDFQHHFDAGQSHNIVWGAGYRLMDDETWNRTQFVGFLPRDRAMNLFSSFIQDEITLVPDRFKLTIGTKIQHTNFTGVEVQPSARIHWTLLDNHMVWAAVSRAVRAPSRIDVDYHIPAYPVPPTSPSVAGGPNFVSEKLIAYELGYRMQPSKNFSLSFAGFYNRYDDLYSVEVQPGSMTYQIENGVEGYSGGAELSGNLMITQGWRLRGGYTYFKKKLKNKPGNVADPSVLLTLGTDAENQAVVQSIIDLPGNFSLDLTSRYVDSVHGTNFTAPIGSYFNLDTRIVWHHKKLELSVAGQNLLDEEHIEVGNKLIQRNVYGKIIWRH